MDFFSGAGEFYALSCAIIWAAAMVLFRKAGDDVSPLMTNFAKNIIGLGLLSLTMLVLGVDWLPSNLTTKDWVVIFFSGAIGIAVADTLLFWSLNLVGAGRAAIIGCLYSPLVTLTAILYLGESLTFAVGTATLLVVGGIVIGTSDRSGKARSRTMVVGITVGVIAELLMAVAIVTVKPVLAKVDPWWLTTARLVTAMPVLLLQASLPRYREDLKKLITPGRHWGVLFWAAFLGAYLALILWVLGFKYTDASTAGVLNQTSTIFVLGLATLFLKEPLTRRKLVGVGMGFVGTLLVVLL